MIKLTPRHYAYLKSLRLQSSLYSHNSLIAWRSRKPASRRRQQEAERLVNAGVRELLVISRTTMLWCRIKYRTVSGTVVR